MAVKISEVLDESISQVRQPRIHVPLRGSDEYRALPQMHRDWETVHIALRNVLKNMREGQQPWPLYLWGSVGSGKTRAILAFCDRLQLARYWTVRNLMEQMIEHHPPWQHRWYRVPYVTVLDELAIHDKATDFELDAVRCFADWREDLPAIYISNHPPAFMKSHYCERVESRLTNGTVYELKGHDRRKDRRKDRQ